MSSLTPSSVWACPVASKATRLGLWPKPMRGRIPCALRWTCQAASMRPPGVRLGEAAFRAALTVTFGVAKVGLFQRDGAHHAGEVVTVPLGMPRALVARHTTTCRLGRAAPIIEALPRRAPDSHKGHHGHVGVLGGAAETPGAARLAARGRASQRCGAGHLARAQPHARDRRAAGDHARRLVTGLARATPTPGASARVLAAMRPPRAIVAAVAGDARPAVVDADALALWPKVAAQARPACVLTPHPKEAATLLGTNTASVQADRVGAATALVQRYGATIVLKGAATLVAAPDRAPVLVARPNPILAVGGAGDVLAGAIAALLGQGLAAWDAALAGVWLHAEAAQRLAADGADRGALASELADALTPTMMGLSAAYGQP